MALEQYSSRSTVHLKGLSQEVDEDLLFELGTQFGIVRRVHIPIDKETMAKADFAFIEFHSPADAMYMKDVIQNSVAPLRLFGKTVVVSYHPTSASSRQLAAAADALLNVGANITISNLDRKMIDLQKLQVHFEHFGKLAGVPKIHEQINNNNNTDSASGGSDTCSATIYFQNHDASDAAIAAFDGQFLFGRRVRVEYAMKEDGSGRHGSKEEREVYQRRFQQQQQQEATGVTARNTHSDDVPPSASNNSNNAAAGNTDWAAGLNPYTSL